jgi:hypothetical protein
MSERHPTVCKDRLPGHKGRLVTDEIDKGLCNFLGGGQPTHWLSRNEIEPGLMRIRVSLDAFA